MKKINVDNHDEAFSITVPTGEPVKLIRGRKSLIVYFIRTRDVRCSDCCFHTGGPGLSKLGLPGCTILPVSCWGGCFKTVDHILEDL